jgi:hypothetical protein
MRRLGGIRLDLAEGLLARIEELASEADGALAWGPNAGQSRHAGHVAEGLATLAGSPEGG